MDDHDGSMEELMYALSQAQREVEALVPNTDSDAPFPVVSAGQVVRKAQTALQNAGVVATISFPEAPQPIGMAGDRVTLFMPVDLTVEYDGESMTVRAWGSSDDSRGYAVEQAQTTAVKQALMKLLMMTDNSHRTAPNPGRSGQELGDSSSGSAVDGVALVEEHDDLKQACQLLGLSEKKIQTIVDGCDGEVQRVRKVLKRKLEDLEDVQDEEIPF